MIYQKNLNDKNKIVTREYFSDNFELLKSKACFPNEFLTKENIYNENLPSIEKFYSSLKLDDISEKDYDKTLEIYKKLKCKNIKEYLDLVEKYLVAHIFGNLTSIISSKPLNNSKNYIKKSKPF